MVTLARSRRFPLGGGMLPDQARRQWATEDLRYADGQGQRPDGVEPVPD